MRIRTGGSAKDEPLYLASAGGSMNAGLCIVTTITTKDFGHS